MKAKEFEHRHIASIIFVLPGFQLNMLDPENIKLIDDLLIRGWEVIHQFEFCDLKMMRKSLPLLQIDRDKHRKFLEVIEYRFADLRPQPAIQKTPEPLIDIEQEKIEDPLLLLTRSPPTEVISDSSPQSDKSNTPDSDSQSSVISEAEFDVEILHGGKDIDPFDSLYPLRAYMVSKNETNAAFLYRQFNNDMVRYLQDELRTVDEIKLKKLELCLKSYREGIYLNMIRALLFHLSKHDCAKLTDGSPLLIKSIADFSLYLLYELFHTPQEFVKYELSFWRSSIIAILCSIPTLLINNEAHHPKLLQLINHLKLHVEYFTLSNTIQLISVLPKYFRGKNDLLQQNELIDNLIIHANAISYQFDLRNSISIFITLPKLYINTSRHNGFISRLLAHIKHFSSSLTGIEVSGILFAMAKLSIDVIVYDELITILLIRARHLIIDPDSEYIHKNQWIANIYYAVMILSDNQDSLYRHINLINALLVYALPILAHFTDTEVNGLIHFLPRLESTIKIHQQFIHDLFMHHLPKLFKASIMDADLQFINILLSQALRCVLLFSQGDINFIKKTLSPLLISFPTYQLLAAQLELRLAQFTTQPDCNTTDSSTQKMIASPQDQQIDVAGNKSGNHTNDLKSKSIVLMPKQFNISSPAFIPRLHNYEIADDATKNLSDLSQPKIDETLSPPKLPPPIGPATDRSMTVQTTTDENVSLATMSPPSEIMSSDNPNSYVKPESKLRRRKSARYGVINEPKIQHAPFVAANSATDTTQYQNKIVSGLYSFWQTILDCCPLSQQVEEYEDSNHKSNVRMQ